MRKLFCSLYFVLLPLFCFSQEGISISSDIHSTCNEYTGKKFILFSIPKSGTHLMKKCLTMLTGLSAAGFPDEWHRDTQHLAAILEYVELLNSRNQFLSVHSYSHLFDDPLVDFLNHHPDYIPIIQIRDLRDAFVSVLYHGNVMDYLKEEMRHESVVSTAYHKDDYTLDDILTHALTRKDENNQKVMNYMFSDTLPFMFYLMNLPRAVVVRFEDLVGAKGGGNDDIQRMVVAQLANALSIELPRNRLNLIAHSLFGQSKGPDVSVTFRSGKIGSWKTYFSDEHLQLFNQYWSEDQRALGY